MFLQLSVTLKLKLFVSKFDNDQTRTNLNETCWISVPEQFLEHWSDRHFKAGWYWSIHTSRTAKLRKASYLLLLFLNKFRSIHWLELFCMFVDNKVVLRIRWSYELRFQHWVLNIFCFSTMVSRSSRQMRWVLVKLVFNSDVPSDSNARLLLLLLEVTKRFNCNFECWKWKLSHTSIIRLHTNVKKKTCVVFWCGRLMFLIECDVQAKLYFRIYIDNLGCWCR